MKRALWMIAVAVAACNREGGDSIVANGTLEIVEVDVAPLTAARVLRVMVEDGDSVRVGDTLAILEQPSLAGDIEQRAARVSASRAGLADLERGARAPEIARAQSQLRALDAQATRLANDASRMRKLYAAGAISQQQLEAAVTASREIAAQREAARQSLVLLQQGNTRERVEGARAEVAAAQATLSSGLATSDALTLLAPIDGVVISRNSEPGETLSPGQSAVTLGEVKQPWTRVYVNAGDIPGVSIGGLVRASVDGIPRKVFNGRVVAINTKAEFTPRVALTEDERADMMFGVKIEFDDSAGLLKPGLPVTVAIRKKTPQK